MNSVLSTPIMMKPNRRLHHQRQFIPVNTYSSIQEQQQQQPLVSDQQYGQSLNQPSSKNLKILIEENLKIIFFFLAAFIQSTPQRSMFRVFQSSPSRMADNLNTQPTSSSYRR
jgi:hypothetical protein